MTKFPPPHHLYLPQTLIDGKTFSLFFFRCKDLFPDIKNNLNTSFYEHKWFCEGLIDDLRGTLSSKVLSNASRAVEFQLIIVK